MFRSFPLLERRLLAKGDGNFPVYIYTFGLHNQSETLSLDLGVGDHIKLFAPWGKPRSYSPTALRPGSFDLTVKLRDGGHVSDYLRNLEVGDSAMISGPFPPTPMKRYSSQNVGLISFGVGITEALQVAMAELASSESSTVVLLNGNRKWSDVLFLEELKQLKTRYGERFKLVHYLSKEGSPPKQHDGSIEHGRIDEKVIQAHFPVRAGADKSQHGWRFLVVGTKIMKKQLHSILEKIGHGDKSSHSLLQKQFAPLTLIMGQSAKSRL
jgi:ferredoxin-NADP reductase